MTWFKHYLKSHINCLKFINEDSFEEFVYTINAAKNSGNTIYFIGNGGSLANCEHIVEDLAGVASNALQKKNPKSARFSAVCLNNPAYITAIANDYSFKDIFVKQLHSVLNQGDVLVGLSVSGTSPNIIKAFDYARKIGVTTIALTGAQAKDKPGSISNIANQSIIFNSTEFGIVEDNMMTFLHMSAYWFMENH